MNKITISIIAFVALIAPISPVFAGTATGALNIQTNLLSSCSVSTTPVNFGDQSVAVGGTATGEVIVNCPSGLSYHIALDAGTNYTGGEQYRRLVTGGGSGISYSLVKEDGQAWGDSDYANTFNSGTSLAGASNGSDQFHPVIGALQGGSTVPGVYTGIVQVTVHW